MASFHSWASEDSCFQELPAQHSPMFQPDLFKGVAEKLKRGIPIRRFAKQSEMSEAILWLSSDKASFVTGHAMPVDGGLTA